MIEVNRKTVINNLVWRLMERFGAQLVSFVVSIVIARILDPSVYGVVAIVTVFTTILQVFVDGGFSTALIQKKDSDDLDFSTVFYFNIVMCFLLYAVMFFLSPLIAKFYNNEQLTNIVRVLSIIIIISGIKSVQVSYVSKHLMFRKFFWSTIIGTVISAAVGVIMAYKGFGVWSLVAQNLVNQAIDTLVLWIVVKWKPKKMFSWERLRTLFSFGWKLLVSGLIDAFYKEARSLIIGKKYSTEDLAYYNKGQQFPQLIVTNVNTSIDSVLLPSMSTVQDKKDRVKSMTKKAISVSTYVMMPLMVGLAMCADSIVSILLTDKWLPCVFFLRIFCFSFAFYPIHTANLNAMKALGRSDYFLKLEVIKKVVGLAILFGAMWISVEAIAWSLLLTTALSVVVNSYPNKKLMNYSLLEQLKDMLPSIVLSAAMGVVVYFVGAFNSRGLMTLLKQILIGGSIYFTGSYLFRIKPFEYIKSFFHK